CLGIAALRQVSPEEAFLDVAVDVAVRPISEIAITQLIAEQGDDAILRDAFGFADVAHTRRILPVSSSCIMPCLMHRALARLASSAAISESMSDRIAAMACCSALVGGRGTQNTASGDRT